MKIAYAALLGLLGTASPAFAADPLPPVAAPAEHSAAADTAKIRLHHLNRLTERLTTPAETLHAHCRFESDIATKPPAKKVVLTFDDGPEPGQTELILEALAKYDIPGTFFLIGSKAAEHPELVEKIQASGRHVIGNHSWTHPNFHEIPVADQASEISRTDALLAARTGQRKLFRYPYGNSSCESNAQLHSDGYAIVGWHIDSCDWAFDKNGSIEAKEAISCGVLAQNRDNFVEHVLSSVRAHDGGIVLMHEIHPKTIRQLAEIIEKIHADGFAFTAITDPDFQPSLR